MLYVVLLFFAAYYLMPIYMLVITSLKPFERVSLNEMWDLPTAFYLDNLMRAWPLVSANFFNSVIITVPAAIISSFIGSLNGYVFAKWKFPHSDLIFMLILFGHLSSLSGHFDPIGTGVDVGAPVRVYGRSDRRPLYFWHADHGVDLPLVLRERAARPARRRSYRWRRSFWTVLLDHAAAGRACVRGRA